MSAKEMDIKAEVATKDMEVIEADVLMVKEGLIVSPPRNMIMLALTSHLKKELSSSIVTYVE